jgi:hypothetical protein
MRRCVWIIGCALLLASPAHAWELPSLGVGDVWKAVGTVGKPTGEAVSQRESGDALREALAQSAKSATVRLGAEGGFSDEEKIRIPLPRRLAEAQATLKPLGMSEPLDDLQLRLNRAAEAAMPSTTEFFVNAAQALTFTDALAMVRGSDDSGTTFLRLKSGAQLAEQMRPILAETLKTKGAFASLRNVVQGVGGVTFADKLEDDLVGYVAGKAADGVFLAMADEERAIRKDPAKRTSVVLRRVFGGAT